MRRFLFLAPLVALACGDDASPIDAMVEDAMADTAETLPVTPPALPSFVPCPPGWREVAGPQGVTLCAPFDDEGIATCGDGEAHFPGTAGCAPIGTPCAADGWPSDLPAEGTIVYVRAGATGGDGTRGLPYGRLADGVRAAGDGGIAAIATGRYDELVRIDNGATLWGACPAETILTTSLTFGALVELSGVGGGLRNLSVAESPIVGVRVREGTVSLESVEIREHVSFGLLVSGGSLTATRLAVRDISPDATGAVGRGLEAAYGSTSDFHEVVIERVHNTGVWLGNADTVVSMSDFVVRSVEPRADGQFGRGFDCFEGARLELSRGVVGGVFDSGIVVDLEGSSALLEDVLIRDVSSRRVDGQRGRGFSVQLGGTAELRRVVVERTHSEAVTVGGDDTRLVVSDLLISDVQSTEGTGIIGDGLQAYLGGELEAHRVLVTGTAQASLAISGAGTSADVEDLTVRDGRGVERNGYHGHGVQVQDFATLRLSRADISGVRGAGMGLFDGGPVMASDVRITDVLPWACAATTCPEYVFGHGLGVYFDSQLTLSRFHVEGAELCGLHLDGPGQVDLEDGVVAGCDIGVCLQAPSYDTDRLTSGVEYRDNTVNLDTTTLPVPDPIDSL